MADYDELEQFKTNVNLVELASFYGYECRQKESCRSSIVMAHPDGDKIVIATAPDGHMIFFSIRQQGRGYSGSVIDFVMYRQGVTLGSARVILRKCLVPGYLDNVAVHYRPEAISESTSGLYAEWLRMSYYKSRGYLAARGLSQETITMFSNRIRVDSHGNVVFRHDDLHSLTGWEMKNRGFTGFVGGGKKALFCGRVGVRTDTPLVVITESAIDAMSYYQLKSSPGFYLSFAGAISQAQLELLTWVVNRYPLARVIAATDNDEAGEAYAQQIHQLRPDIERDRPLIGKDWNDVLNNREARGKGHGRFDLSRVPEGHSVSLASAH